MNKKLKILLLVSASFLSGFAFKSMLPINQPSGSYKKVTGIGGIFFKCKDTKKLKVWYHDNLGFNTDAYGTVFEWRQGADSSKKGFTQWSPFKESTNYFNPSTKDFMINYRVGNLERLVTDLKANGVTVTDSIETYDYGKFVHIMDIEGNKIELWEPNDEVYEQLGKKMGSATTK